MAQGESPQSSFVGRKAGVFRLLPPLPLFLLQPLLARIVRKIAADFPSLLDRLGPHRATRYLIDPTNVPFTLLLQLDPAGPVFKACDRSVPPAHDARIAASFLSLLRLVDQDEDGDAMFFSRDLEISGNTEAVVTLRNAIDDVDGSVVDSVAGMFGPAGRAALGLVRKINYPPNRERHQT